MSSLDNSRPRKGRLGFRIALVAVFVAGFIAFFAFGLDDYVTFESLREHRAWLQNAGS